MRPKTLKKCMKLNWNFQRGGEVLEKIPSVGEVWLFSGTIFICVLEIYRLIIYLLLYKPELPKLQIS